MCGLRKEDIALIELLKNNPEQGVKKALDSYGRSVKWIISKILGRNRPEDIEECISEVFIRLWNNIERFDKERNVPLSSYIYGIARYVALDRLRKAGKTQADIGLEVESLEVNVDYTNELAKKINNKIIKETIDALPWPDRDIFICRYYYGEKIQEIACRLDIPVKQVENKLFRGKKKLKDALVERGIIL